MAKISGVVIALNEEHQLHYALGTLLPWCDEVIVVDQHSEDETAALAERLAEAGFATGAETAAVVLARRTQIDQGFEHYRDVNGPDVEVAEVRAGGAGKTMAIVTREAADITRRGIEFLRSHRAEPFFLWLHYFDLHEPYLPPPELMRRFRDSPYHGELAHVDRQLGRLFDALGSTGLTEKTLVVLTSDHGESLGEHGENTHSAFVYESTMRIPLVFSGPPELSSGQRVAAPVRSIDIAPTILDWLGLSPLEQADGTSLLPLLRGQRDFSRRTAYGESIELTLMRYWDPFPFEAAMPGQEPAKPSYK